MSPVGPAPPGAGPTSVPGGYPEGRRPPAGQWRRSRPLGADRPGGARHHWTAASGPRLRVRGDVVQEAPVIGPVAAVRIATVPTAHREVLRVDLLLPRRGESTLDEAAVHVRDPHGASTPPPSARRRHTPVALGAVLPGPVDLRAGPTTPVTPTTPASTRNATTLRPRHGCGEVRRTTLRSTASVCTPLRVRPSASRSSSTIVSSSRVTPSERTHSASSSSWSSP